MLNRRSDEGSLLESSNALEPLDLDERDNFLGKSSAQNFSEKKENPAAVIGSKIRFKGELYGEEDLLIQGQIEGTVELKSHNLTVGEQGNIKANVSAKTITIEGKVQGDINGKEKVSIKKSSNVQGNIKATRVVLEDGAKFRGSIDMDMELDTNKPKNPKPPSSDISKETH